MQNSGKYIGPVVNGIIRRTQRIRSQHHLPEAADNTGVCVDMTGADDATIQHVHISRSGAGLY